MHEPHWITRYAACITSTKATERELIVDRHLTESAALRAKAVFFAPRPVVETLKIGLGRISRPHLLAAYGRCNLGRLLTTLERLDFVISKAAGLLPSIVTAHYAIYGQDEYAHAPTNPYFGGFISLNIGQVRVRALLEGIMQKNPTALCAIADLIMHEKAHLARPAKDKKAEHDAAFYMEKTRLKDLFCEAIQWNKKRDPFRTVRFANTRLPTADDLMLKFPYMVQSVVEVITPETP